MNAARLAALCAVVLASQGCRAFHETAIKQRLTQRRFFAAREVTKPLAEIDTFLTSRKQDVVRSWCELCLISALTNPDGSRTYCLSSHEEESCVVARSTPSGGTRFEPVPGAPMASAQVVRSLWNNVDFEASIAAEVNTEQQIAELAAEEEEQFTPRWSFIAGAKTGAVVSNDPPSFTFGGQVGFRYWGSLFVVPGAVVEVESMIQAGRNLATAGAQGRIELTLWSEENARFVNLPRISFLMSGGPLVGFGKNASLGGRAVFGLHLIHLGRFVTPFFFELGFQALEVDEQTATGLRIAVGLGF
ncbi:MAG: hypothetical protein Q8N23_01425 [Archangium sp.]|nr:hypothetical protein [Archangium sp.]MDP3151298.1 hypothetical protein [Archangium sp.]MDP3571645.1 hypothetical protein [Archangium sp.]